jgi:large subunit ribosomal protein L31
VTTDEVLFGYLTNREQSMKKDIHPAYREVVFHDLSCDFKFVTRSTIQTRENITVDGKEYPLVKIEVSAESHPFYTGKHKIVDTAGRVEKFRQKFGSVGSKTAIAAG